MKSPVVRLVEGVPRCILSTLFYDGAIAFLMLSILKCW
jgi:hypothetical protein